MTIAAQRIPLFANRSAIEPHLDEIRGRVSAVLDSGVYILGPEVAAFERDFAEFCERSFCIGVANGTDALTIALRALGVGPGDEVIVPAYTFFATAEAIVNAGARPVFCDVDPQTRCITAATAGPLTGARTRALIPVHMYGRPAPMRELTEFAEAAGIHLVADAAQAAGARYDGRAAGAWGDAAAFSFYPGKNLGAFGDAGAIVTDDAALDAECRILRAHGSRARWQHVRWAFNSRLDEVQAAVLRVLLPQVDAWTEVRRARAAEYSHGLRGVDAPAPDLTEHCFHLYVILSEQRDDLEAALDRVGIESRPYYAPALPFQPVVGGDVATDAFPGARLVANRCLALPMGPSLTTEQVSRVTAEIARLETGA